MKLDLSIERTVLHFLKQCAAQIPHHEYIGLLAAEPGSHIITSACLLPSHATGGSAIAAPESIKQAMADLDSSGRRPIGLVHSHGRHSTYHSSRDDRTLLGWLAAAIAHWTLEAVSSDSCAPQLCGDALAILPQPRGRTLSARLVGPPLADLGNLPARWTQIAPIDVGGSTRTGIELHDGILKLFGGGSGFELGIPDSATLMLSIAPAEIRRGRVVSLVLNARGETLAEAFDVVDAKGRLTIDRGPCQLELVGGEPEGDLPVNGAHIHFSHSASRDAFGRQRSGTTLQTWITPP